MENILNKNKINEEVYRIKSLMSLINEEIITEGVIDKLITKFIEKQVIKSLLSDTERVIVSKFLKTSIQDLSQIEIKELYSLMKTSKGDTIIKELKSLVSDATLPQEKATLNSKIGKLQKMKDRVVKSETKSTAKTGNFLDDLLNDLENSVSTLDAETLKTQLKSDMEKLGVELKIPKKQMDLLYEDIIKKLMIPVEKIGLEGGKALEKILKDWERYPPTQKKIMLDKMVADFKKAFSKTAKDVESKFKIPGIGGRIQKIFDGWTTHWFTKYLLGGTMVRGEGLMRAFTFYFSTLAMTTIYSIFGEIFYLGTKTDDTRTVKQRFSDFIGNVTSDNIATEIFGKYLAPGVNMILALCNFIVDLVKFGYSRLVEPIKIGSNWEKEQKDETSFLDKQELTLKKRSILKNAPYFPYSKDLSIESGQLYLTYENKKYPILKDNNDNFYINDSEVGTVLLKDMK